MRKDMYRRSKDVESTEATADENGDPLSGSADPFDALVSGKTEDTSAGRSNGKRKPSPIPDDSDAEHDAETKDDEKSETNGDSAVDSVDNGDATAGGEDEGYEVEDIVDHKFKGKKKYFKIRWKNYEEDQDTWEPEEDLACPEIIERYLEKHPEAAVKKTPGKEKKVRISLPPSRSAPKRTAAERKSIVDEPMSDDDNDGDDNDSTAEKKKPSPGKRGRPKKGSSPKSKAGKSYSKPNEVYEVLKVIDDEMRGGKKYYRIRWKGWSAKDDTWEPKASLSCPELIKEYENNKVGDEEEYEVEKIVGEKIEYGVRFFLVKWKGWPESSNSWQEDNTVDCHDLIEKFRDSCRSASSKSNKRSATTAPKASKAKKAKKANKKKNDSEGEDNDSDNVHDYGDNGDFGADEKEWEVERVINQRKKDGKKEYLIRWKGCKAADDTWEPEDGISCPELIAAFLKKNKK